MTHNGTELQAMTYNGQAVNTWVHNGVEVFTVKPITVLSATYAGSYDENDYPMVHTIKTLTNSDWFSAGDRSLNVLLLTTYKTSGSTSNSIGTLTDKAKTRYKYAKIKCACLAAYKGASLASIRTVGVYLNGELVASFNELINTPKPRESDYIFVPIADFESAKLHYLATAGRDCLLTVVITEIILTNEEPTE